MIRKTGGSAQGQEVPAAKPRPVVAGLEGMAGPCEACQIRQLSICSALADHEITALEEILTQQTLASGQALFYEGDAADHVYNVTRGTVRLSKLLPDGRRQVTGFLLAGDFLGFARDQTYSYSAEAVDDVQVCRFTVREFEALFERFPQLERRLLAKASNELAEAQDQMLLLGRKSPREKLASFLLRMHRRQQDLGGAADPLQLTMGRGDIADYLGLTVETVSRSFTHLRKEGFLELPDPNTVVFANLDGLSELAE